MRRRKHMPAWKVVAFASPALAVLIPLVHGVSVGFEPRSILWLALAGAAIGLIIAPLLEPKAFPNALLWQVFFSVLACVFVAIQQQAGKLGFAIALVAGVLIGLTAKWWAQGLP
jgi:hypothetical protein